MPVTREPRRHWLLCAPLVGDACWSRQVPMDGGIRRDGSTRSTTERMPPGLVRSHGMRGCSSRSSIDMANRPTSSPPLTSWRVGLNRFASRSHGSRGLNRSGNDGSLRFRTVWSLRMFATYLARLSGFSLAERSSGNSRRFSRGPISLTPGTHGATSVRSTALCESGSAFVPVLTRSTERLLPVSHARFRS